MIRWLSDVCISIFKEARINSSARLPVLFVNGCVNVFRRSPATPSSHFLAIRKKPSSNAQTHLIRSSLKRCPARLPDIRQDGLPFCPAARKESFQSPDTGCPWSVYSGYVQSDTCKDFCRASPAETTGYRWWWICSNQFVSNFTPAFRLEATSSAR